MVQIMLELYISYQDDEGTILEIIEATATDGLGIGVYGLGSGVLETWGPFGHEEFWCNY